MPSIKALTFTAYVLDWLVNSSRPRMLHVFDSACNLINERGEVLSVVTPQVGNGPFNLVIADEVCFTMVLNLQSRILTSPLRLTLGDLAIRMAKASLWNPRPEWERLHLSRDPIAGQLTRLERTARQAIHLQTGFAATQSYAATISTSQIPDLCSVIAAADVPSAITLTSQLAGLGPGLTPAGDDVLMGAIYAVWILHEPEFAKNLAGEIANTAAPKTTSLSAAWLRAAGKGEAGSLWIAFFEALVSVDPVKIQTAMENILAVGQTSGADALTGFIGTVEAWVKEVVTRDGRKSQNTSSHL